MDDLSGGITSVTLLFALVLALSLLIERVLEVLVALHEVLDSRYDCHRFWSRQAERIRNAAERKLRVFEYVDPANAAPVLNRLSEILLNRKEGYSGIVPVLSGDLVRALYVKVAAKGIAIVLGIGVAFWIHLDLIALWHDTLPDKEPKALRMIISGVIIGLGSPVVHKVITAIERKQKERNVGGARPC